MLIIENKELDLESLSKVIKNTIKKEHYDFCLMLKVGQFTFEELGYKKEDVLKAMDKALGELWQEHYINLEEREIQAAIASDVALLDLIFGR